jgi:hypothetical protein
MTVPTFTTTFYLTRGPMEREIEVEVTYTFDGLSLDVIVARDLTQDFVLTRWEMESAYDAAAAECDASYAEWARDNVLAATELEIAA